LGSILPRRFDFNDALREIVAIPLEPFVLREYMRQDSKAIGVLKIL
jgi:hypothetical protein